ncbi:MAG: TlpA family protein disulfide reductase [Bacteroidaceae bacterium]|nr:TlpA family protein disulfide reductase [Bacteroidaceae bacterium]
MKKIFLTAFAAIALAACANKPANEYIVTLDLNGTSATATDSIFFFNQQEQIVNSGKLVNGKVEIKGIVEEAQWIKVLGGNHQPVVKDTQSVTFILEPGANVTITGNKAVGGLNDEACKYNDIYEDISKQVYKSQELFQAGKMTETEFKAEYKAAIESLAKEFAEGFKAHAKDVLGEKLFALWAAFANPTTSQMKEIATCANADFLQKGEAAEIYEDALSKESTAAGSKYTDFEADGHKFSEYLSTQKYNVVDFWASWCAPCRKEINATLKPLYAEFKDKINIIGVATWDKPEDTANAMKQMNIEWPVMMNTQKIASKIYGISGIPHIMIISPDGIIVCRDIRGDELIAKVKELINK